MSTEHVYMPNEVFTDLTQNIHNSSQIAFAYSYIYYITYLYRYCKHIDNDGNKVTQEHIKEYLGYSPKNKKIDYIIKKGGILDNLRYTETTTDYPIQFLYDDNDLILFETISYFKEYIKNFNDRNFKIKKPLKSFYRTPYDCQHKFLTGTFYSVENTHRIDYNTFHFIIHNNELGALGFYIYSFLKHKNNIYKSGYQRSYEKLGYELHMSDKTIYKYINTLEQKGLLTIDRKIFDMHLAKDDIEANIYNII